MRVNERELSVDQRRVDDAKALDKAGVIASELLILGRYLFAVDDDPIAELPMAQLRVCAILYHGRRSMSALSKELGVSLSAMTQIADRLERGCLVQRVGEESDRRVRSLQLTDRGEKILRHREQTRTRRVFAALSQLSPETQEEIVAAIRTFATACAALAGREPETETETEPTGQPSA